jgi:hypothetical protein
MERTQTSGGIASPPSAEVFSIAPFVIGHDHQNQQMCTTSQPCVGCQVSEAFAKGLNGGVCHRAFSSISSDPQLGSTDAPARGALLLSSHRGFGDPTG